MCRILVRTADNIHVDPEVDRRGCYKKGYPVVIQPDTHRFGRSENLPNFVVLDCPELDWEVARAYNNSWEKQIDYNVISADPATGSYQVEVFGSNTNVSGEAAISLSQVETYLAKWGATVDSNTTNSVTFTLALWQTLQNEGFWGVDVSSFDFTLNSYDAGTGIADVTVSLLTEQQIASAAYAIAKIEENGGLVIGETTDSVTFTIERSVVLDSFKADVKEKVQSTYCRKQYYFNSATVDQAMLVEDTFDGETQLTTKGVLVLSQAEVMAALQNKLEE